MIMESLQTLVIEYRRVNREIHREKNTFKRIGLLIKFSAIEYNLFHRIYELPILELLKEFRIMYVGQFSNTKNYNTQIKVYEMIGTDCLDIYFKYNYIIKFRYSVENTFIVIDGNYPDANKLLIEVPYEIEYKLRSFIRDELVDILNF